MLFVTQEVLVWINVLLSVPNVYFLYSRWEKMDHISDGHFWSGLISTFLATACLGVCAIKPELAYIFMILGVGAILISLGYEHWYFDRYPVKLLKLERNPPYVPVNKFLKQLAEDSDTVRSRWLQPLARTKVQWGIAVFLIGFGFVRVMNAVSYGNQLVAAEQVKTREALSKVPTNKQVNQVVATAVKQAVAPVVESTSAVLETVTKNTTRLQVIEKKSIDDNKEEQQYRKNKKKYSSKIPAYVTPIPTVRTALDSLEDKPIQLTAELSATH